MGDLIVVAGYEDPSRWTHSLLMVKNLLTIPDVYKLLHIPLYMAPLHIVTLASKQIVQHR